MKILKLELNNKSYMTGKITAYISKEALKLQRDAIEIGKIGMELQNAETDFEKIKNLLEKLEEIRNRKVWLICEVYKNQFTGDELEKELSDEEIDMEVNKIILGVTGVIQKN